MRPSLIPPATMELLPALAALAASAFTSATLLPGTSEAALLFFLHHYPAHSLAGWGAASAANTLGSLTSYAIGRFLPERRIHARAAGYLKHHGVWLLLFSWVPLVGDALPLAAGWLRLSPWLSALMLLTGKSLRYALIIWGGYWFGIGHA